MGLKRRRIRRANWFKYGLRMAKGELNNWDGCGRGQVNSKELKKSGINRKPHKFRKKKMWRKKLRLR